MATILVVDDEENLRLTISAFIKAEGHTVFTAENAVDALAMLENQRIDIVFTDIVMPRMSGVQLLEKMRHDAPETLVIIMTGEPTVSTATDALRQGAIDYLVKPVSKPAIMQILYKALHVKELHDEKHRLEIENRHYQDHLEKQIDERTEALNTANEQLVTLLTQLAESFDGIVQALATTNEWRDPYTAGHQRRVAQLSVAIARQLGGSSDDLAKMRVAGLLHDLGKIVVPPEILSKPGKLLAPEFALIKLHPKVGYDILRTIKFAWPIAQIVQQHHLRLDGSGYPKNLLRSKVLFESKILMVADVVEAMSSHRPYRPAFGIKAALHEVEKGAGNRYDRDVVHACIQVYKNKDFQLN
ncbi:MAG: HD domain-containing phosphohydrolase [Armatimonadota bacterium]